MDDIHIATCTDCGEEYEYTLAEGQDVQIVDRIDVTMKILEMRMANIVIAVCKRCGSEYLYNTYTDNACPSCGSKEKK